MKHHCAIALLAVTLSVVSLNAQMNSVTGPGNLMSTEVLAPAAGRGPGAFGSFWNTDLWIKGTQGSTVTLEFHAIDSTSDSATATAQIVLSSPVMYLPDVMKATFGLDQGLGNILMRSTRALSATIRVFARAGTGSYGSTFMAMPTSMAMRGSGGMMRDDDQYQMYVLGLLPEPQARVNVMITNASAVAINGTMDVLDADGSVPSGGSTSMPFSIRAYSSHQFGGVLSNVTSRFGTGAGLQVRVRMADGSTGMMMVVASVVDNITNDTYTVMGSMMDGQRAMMP
jgi:hypothetical protein